MTDTAQLEQKVKDIIVEELGVEHDKLTDDAHFMADLGADSLDTVELVMAFEEEFGCEIPDDAAEKILTVGDAVKFLEDANAVLAKMLNLHLRNFQFHFPRLDSTSNPLAKKLKH